MPGLRFLVKICTDLGMKDVDEYKTKLARLEKGNLNRASNETISNAGVVPDPSEEEVVGSFGFHSSLTKKPSSLFAEENKLSSVFDF